MRKVDTLRQALIGALPELASHPARLKLWIERGTAQSRQTSSFAFCYNFRLNILVEEMATNISVLALAIFIWLRINQPDLLAPGATGFSFEADILDNRTADVLVQLELTQDVTVAAAEGGRWTLQDLDEPDPLFDDALGLGGFDPAALLNRIRFSGGEIVGADGLTEIPPP